MTEIVTTFTGFEVKSGTNDNGPWKLVKFVDAEGKRFQTFDEDIAEQGQGMIGQLVRVEFEVESRQSGGKTRTNNKILALYDPSAPSGSGGGGGGGGAASEAQLKLMAAQTAATLAAAGAIDISDLEDLVAAADNLFAWATGTLEIDDDDISPPGDDVTD